MIDLLAGMILEVGGFSSTFQEDTKTNVSHRFRVGYENVYLWQGREEPEIRLIGQFMGDMTINSFGIGVTHSWGEVSGFIEAGYGIVDLDANKAQQAEVNYTYLVARHHVPGRPIPVSCAKRGCFGTEHEIDSALLARVGIEYRVAKHVKVSASYKWMHADEYLSIYDFQRKADNKGWWEESITRDLSAFEVGLVVTW